ncbi:hypothetical protein DHEL01_v201934 [Diaporthe helianthi]|uniref:Uncharacterized protein n=1 Tax=Diaporthe helianthi TaxID=158607 RepID=A0A2P5IB64_DIAHE|nr:hypothetical protein DHEL01_v201934 [Diaporthe helianthi]
MAMVRSTVPSTGRDVSGRLFHQASTVDAATHGSSKASETAPARHGSQIECPKGKLQQSNPAIHHHLTLSTRSAVQTHSEPYVTQELQRTRTSLRGTTIRCCPGGSAANDQCRIPSSPRALPVTNPAKSLALSDSAARMDSLTNARSRGRIKLGPDLAVRPVFSLALSTSIIETTDPECVREIPTNNLTVTSGSAMTSRTFLKFWLEANAFNVGRK